MVPKADSGAFLLLFLLVLTVTEPLRPGARGWGRGRGWGWGRPPVAAGRPLRLGQGTSEARLRASGRPLRGHKLECTWVRSLEDPRLPSAACSRSRWPGVASRAHPCAGAGWKSGGRKLLVEAPGVPRVRPTVA